MKRYLIIIEDPTQGSFVDVVNDYDLAVEKADNVFENSYSPYRWPANSPKVFDYTVHYKLHKNHVLPRFIYSNSDGYVSLFVLKIDSNFNFWEFARIRENEIYNFDINEKDLSSVKKNKKVLEEAIYSILAN
jgi:hypothetical protein